MSRSLVLLVSLLVSPTALAAKRPAPPPVPAPEPAPIVDPEAWRAVAPTPGAEPAWAPPAAKTFALANGIPVYFVENPGLPLVSVRLHVGAGREVNPAGKAGLAALTNGLLDEGTKTRSATEIAEAAASLGAQIEASGSDGSAFLALDALTGEALAPSLDLFAEIVLQPALGAAEFARVKAETIAAIDEAKAEPRDGAQRLFLAQMFGADHPYGTPAIGTRESVSGLKRGDAKKLYKTWYHAGNAAFVVTGAITEAEARTLLEARFGAWKVGSAVRPSQPPAAAPIKTRVVFMEQPGAVQSVLRVGTVGVTRASPEYFPATMAGTIVGGMFSSRINMNLREEHGWSYGAYAGFTDSRDAGLFAARTSVQADKTAPAVQEVIKELTAAAKSPPTAAELAVARGYLLKSLPGNFETNALTASSLLDIPRYGLGPDAFAAYVRDIGAVTDSASAAAAVRHFDPAKLLVVVVGPRTIEVGEGAAKTTVDIVGTLKALGYEFVDATPAP